VQIAEGAVMATEGAGSTATLEEPSAAQPVALWTFTPSETDPEGPAVNLMLRDPAPLVIVPFVIVQE
jgi:hypothetical protein